MTWWVLTGKLLGIRNGGRERERQNERALTIIFKANTSWLCYATRRSQKSCISAEKFAYLYPLQCIEQWKRAESTHNIDHVFDVISGTIYQHIILLHVACSVQHVQIKLNAARLWFPVCLTAEFASLHSFRGVIIHSKDKRSTSAAR